MADPVTLLAIPIVEKITKETYKFGKRKYNDVYGVKYEIEKLQSNLKSIAAVLADAERCSKKPKQLIDWLTKLRGAALDVENVLETYATEAALREMKNHPAPIAWLSSRLNAANDIKKIARSIDEIDKQRGKYHIKKDEWGEGSAEPATWLGMRERDNRRESGVVGRDKEKEEIVTWLISENSSHDNGRVPVYPITGMGGLGKTTLAQLAYNDERVFKKKLESSYFKNAAWVNVSVDFSVDRILKEIIERLTEMEHGSVSQESIKSNILKVLDGKPFLLVLDDVWISEKTDWEGLHTFLRSCPRGSKVLVTSRSHDVRALMGATRSCSLEVLPEELCWDLFTKELCLGDNILEEEKIKIGKDIIKKCNQLPLPVKAMAAIMREKSLEYWRRVSKNSIWIQDESNEEFGRSNILPALVLSYNHLPSSILKQCFAYCSIFPKNHLFDKHELVKLWMAEGYIPHPSSRSTDTLEDIGGDYFDELQSRSFFQLFVDNERYRMHDLILELAQHVSDKSSKQMEEETTIGEQNSYLHVSFLCEDVQKPALEILKAEKLRTLLLPSSYTSDFGQSLNKMFQTLKYMRVLDLSSTKLVHLPKSIKKLKLLHFLDLSRTELKFLPKSICKLLNLQILKLLGCLWLQELPKDLGNLKDLRYLELDEMFWYKCSRLPPSLGGLTNLHNLHCFHVHRDSGYGIQELKRMKSLQGMLHISKLENAENSKEAKLNQKQGITKLILEWSKEDASSPQERVLEDLEPNSGLQELQILHYKGNRLPTWMSNGVLQNLNKISLKNCANCKTLSFGPLPHLQQLIIKGMLELEEWPETTPYLSLRRLTISNCPKLRNLPCKSFITLQVMKIKQCHALKALPVTPYLMFLTLIDNDLLEDWSEILMGIVVDSSHEGADKLTQLDSLENQLENNNTLQMPKLLILTKKIGGLEADGSYIAGSYILLLELNLVNCPRLQKLPESFAPQKLKISRCPLLTTLPVPQQSQRLQNLELDKCNGTRLIEAIQSSNSLAALTISNISNMASIPKLPHLPTLRTLHIHNCQNLESLSHEDGSLKNFTSLKFLSVSGCENLVTFPEQGLPASIDCLIINNCNELQSFHATSRNYLKSLTLLKDLYLEDCPKLEFLPEDGLPASLQHLRIRGCPLLTEQCNEDAGGRYCQMVSHVADLELDSANTSHSTASACFTCK